MRHSAPAVVGGGGLRKPDVAGITGKMPVFQCTHDRVAVAGLAARRVHETGGALHFRRNRLRRASPTGASRSTSTTTRRPSRRQSSSPHEGRTAPSTHQLLDRGELELTV